MTRTDEEMLKDTVEEMVTILNTNRWDELQPVERRQAMRDFVTTAYNKGVEVGRAEVVNFAQTLCTLIERGNAETAMNIIKEKSTPLPDDKI